jgi:hypothetical protein
MVWMPRNSTKATDRKRRSKGAKDVLSSEDEAEDNTDLESEEGSVEIRDCIVVETR